MRGVHSEIGVIEGRLCYMNFVNLVLNRETFESESMFKRFLRGKEPRDCRAVEL
jgi:hypothetical protein